MMKRKALALILAAGFAVGSYATDARIAVMGRQSTPWFYRDEVSVFNNPADMSLYPNLIYGSFGWIPNDETSDNFDRNFNPKDPHFGGMISYRFSEEENGPMLSIGAFVNRRDGMVEKLLEEGGTWSNARVVGNTTVDDIGTWLPTGTSTDSYGKNRLIDPLGKIDVLFGYDIGNGLALGLGVYTAFQTEKEADKVKNQTEFYKGSLGLNWNIEQGLDFEASVNAGITTAKFDTSGNEGNEGRLSPPYVVSDGEYFLRGDVRFFSAVPAINGSFVPQVSLEYLKLNSRNTIDLNGGVGINMNIDRGFFWAGLQGVYTQVDGGDKTDNSIGGRLSFGIERNVVWDWFLIRVGGQKELRFHSDGKNNSSWWENETNDGRDDDLVGLGFGINIDNRLRIDFVASEDLPYTFTGLISGSPHHLFNRVSATYRF
jgi:hypothetical protein